MIHHHAVAFVEPGGTIWLPSFIARWVDALAQHFDELLLLMHESPSRTGRQDESIGARNVRLVSMGPEGRFWDRVPRMRRIVAACQTASEQADALIVRGTTPRQFTVWKHVDVPHKAFLLVGSITTPPRFDLRSFDKVHAFAMFYKRRRELKKIGKSGVMLANSPQTVSELAEATGSQVHFVPTNSIRKAEFQPLQVRPIRRPARLLFCGRVTVEKGIFELLSAIAMLNQEGVACALDVVGAIAPEMRAEIDTALGRLNLRDKVRLHDRIPYGPAMFAFYHTADLFVLPSYTEGFPHVLWESAANSCPVVCTNVPGIAALWADSRHAVMVRPRDDRSLCDGIRRVLEDDSLRERLVTESHALASSFHVEACAERAAIILREQWQ